MLRKLPGGSFNHPLARFGVWGVLLAHYLLNALIDSAASPAVPIKMLVVSNIAKIFLIEILMLKLIRPVRFGMRRGRYARLMHECRCAACDGPSHVRLIESTPRAVSIC